MLADHLLPHLRDKAPIALLAEASLRYLLDPAPIDRLFDDHAERQYTRRLLLSTLVDLLADVVLRAQPSVRQAYRAAGDVGASLTAVYDKLSRLEPGLGQALVRDCGTRAAAVHDALSGSAPPGWFGCREVRILDGNVLRGSQHRLAVLRATRASALAGLSVAVLDPQRELVVDLFPCEDGHAQERRVLPQVLDSVTAGSLWLGDRNYCTTAFVGGLLARGAFFIIRRHAATVQGEAVTPLRRVGATATGDVDEQHWRLTNVSGGAGTAGPVVRHIVVRLKKPTRDGETELRLLTNLPRRRASARAVARAYRRRWRIEALFQRLTVVLRGEVRPLGYPRAALFGFAVASLASNAWAAVTAALQAAHPDEAVREELSHYQLSLELLQQRAAVALLEESWWEGLLGRPPEALGAWLLEVARGVSWPRYAKTHRGPKKPRPARPKCPRYRHVSTQKLLDQHKKKAGP